ncbi:hypothetical protein S40288_04958 [Stachybotrys chartarum IBT 40288]|nr:hypothetical protein S40288_04958 [Stachybotrys chartarum IBT 40288]
MDNSAVLPPDHNRGPEILAICGTAVGFALVVVIMRVWVRIRIIGKMGWDDYFMIAAMVRTITTMFAEMMVIIPQVDYGAGRHYQYIKPESNIAAGLHLNFVTQPLCLIALCLTKVSIGFFLLRMTQSPRFRYTIRGVMVFTILSSTGNLRRFIHPKESLSPPNSILVTVFFQCRPLAFTWDPAVPGGECIPTANLRFAAFFNSSVSALTDLVFALLPVPMMWKVQLKWKVKVAVATLLSLGVFVTAAAIVKITFLGDYGQHGDFLYDSSDLTIWTTIEICTAILAASIPCLKPLFKALLGGSLAERYAYKYNNTGYLHNRSGKMSQTCLRNVEDMELYSRPRRTATNFAVGRSGTGSEENIMNSADDRNEGIIKTTEISITLGEDKEKTATSII